ncbi:MAG TPA: VCBS repeat-containing protein [Planctomycetota bacterium]|nr:VCBS repeat-containing protein [Planctomycetota bacterium]
MSVQLAAVVALLVGADTGAAQVSARAVQQPGKLTYVYDRATFAAGASPVAIVRADFDGDGRADLATADNGAGTVSVLLAKDHGAFHPPVAYDAGVEPNALAAADLDGDGAIDLVVVDQNCPSGSCGDGVVRVLLGAGDGSFGQAHPFAVDSNPQSVAIGDFDGDGVPDLAVVNAISIITQGPGTVSILVGRGNGSFDPQVEYDAGQGPSAIVAEDLDGDGVLDLGIVNYVAILVAHAVVTLHGHGDATFDAPVSHLVAVGPVDLLAQDLDASGAPDLVTANLGDNSVSVLRDDGAGGFLPHLDFPAGFGPEAVAAADLDGDARPDLALPTFTAGAGGGSLALLHNLGGAVFAPAVEYQTGPIGAAIVAADVDGDGATDFVAPNQSSGVSVYLGHADGTLLAPALLATANGPVAVATADFNGDNHADLAVVNSLGNSFSILAGKGDGSFGPRVDAPAAGEPSALVAADMNRDGLQDLVMTHAAAGRVSVRLGRGDGTFLPAQSFAAGGDPVALTVADFDADGLPDVAVAALGANGVEVLPGNGDGTLQPKLHVPAGPGPASIVHADFNGDGRVDLAVADVNTGSFGPGKVAFLAGHGDGTFASPVLFDAGIEAAAVATGDFNHDAKPDLAAVTNLDVFGFAAILLGDGAGGFAPQVTYPTGRFSVAAVVADFDGDKSSDLAVANVFDNTVTILHGHFDGTFSVQARHGAGFGPAALVAGRFDGGLAPDLAIVDQVNALAILVSP